MTIQDATLIMAMSDVTEGRRILFVTHDDSEADIVSKKAVQLLIESLQIHGKMTLSEAQSFVLPSSNSWLIQLQSHGWVLFCPSSLISQSGDFGNPSHVYVRGPKSYERVTYMSWRTSLSQNEAQETLDDVLGENITAWDRLMAGD